MHNVSGLSRVQRTFYFFALLIARIVYRVSASGQERLPSGGFLLLPNHISFVDAIVLQLACPRRVRYIVDEGFYRNKILHPFLRLAGCIPISRRHAKEAVRLAAEQIRAGEIV